MYAAMPRIPHRFTPVVTAFLLSGLMSCMVSGISTLRSIGLAEMFFVKWMTNWAWSWSVAFPAVIVVLPVVRAIVARIVAPPPRP
jgi:hypothetical protein